MWKRILILAAAALVCACQAACAEARWINKHTESYFGTVTVLRVLAEPAEAEQIWAEIKQMLGELEQSVSVSREGSDVHRFNALPGGGELAVTPLTAQVISRARALYALSEGCYDPTVYPLVDLWGFSPRFNTRSYQPVMPYDREKTDGQLPMPDPAWIGRLMPLVGFDGVALAERDGQWVLAKGTPDVVFEGVHYAVQIDLGGLAKGYACDRAMEILAAHGCADGYFSCGGSSITVLKNAASPDGCFEIQLQKPREGLTNDAYYGLLRAADISLSTSNDVSQCWRYDGAVYSHLIDPATGWPVNTSPQGEMPGIISVTLFGAQADECDGLTTALMLMGPERADDWLAAHPGYGAVYVCRTLDGMTVHEALTEGMTAEYFDPAYPRVP